MICKMGEVIRLAKPYWIAQYVSRHKSIGAAPKPLNEELAMDNLMRATRAYFKAIGYFDDNNFPELRR